MHHVYPLHRHESHLALATVAIPSATGILMLVAGVFQGSWALYQRFVEWSRKRKEEPLYRI